VLRNLVLGPASAADLAHDLGLPIEQVRYQLTRLKADGLVSVWGQRQRRGTREQIFRANPRRAFRLESELVSEAPLARRAYQEPILRTLFSEVLEAIRAGAFHDRFDHTVAHVPLSLDIGGYRELETILDHAVERLFAIRDQSLQRSEGVARGNVLAVSGLIHLAEGV
jgi:DNA-binding transcriptional ArsR family regulator